MLVTWPTLTPDMVTGEPTLRSPTLSNCAVTRNPALAPRPNLRPLEGSCVVRNSSAAKPSSTNSPVPISRVRLARIMWNYPLQEGRRQHVVQEQHDDRGGHHGARGGQSDACGRGFGVIPLVYRDQAARE